MADVLAYFTPKGLTSDQCWPWLGTPHGSTGYGQFMFNRKKKFAHRVAWQVANGRELTEGEQVRHKCDNRICVNPSHLDVGTLTDNMHDMISRGRAVHPAKIDADAVRSIRARRAEGISVHLLAKEYEVSISTIYKIEQRVRRYGVA